MSLLLDALKRAAEAKARQESAPSGAPPTRLKSVAGPAVGGDRPIELRDDSLDPAEAFERDHDDSVEARFSPYDEFDETQQLEGDFGDKNSATYGSKKHPKSVFSSQRVQRPLRPRLPVIKSLGFLLFVCGCAAAGYIYIQDREFELQRQLIDIRKNVPIMPPPPREQPVTVATAREATKNTVGQSAADSARVAEVVAVDERVVAEIVPAATSGEASTSTRDQVSTGTVPIESKQPAAVALASDLPLGVPVKLATGETDTVPGGGETVAQKPPRGGQLSSAGDNTGELRISHRSRQFEADIQVRDAYAAYQAGNLDRAQQFYDTALQLDRDHRDALLGRAAIFLHRDKSREAIDIYRRLLVQNPRDHAALAGLNSMARDGDLQRYESDLLFLLDESPDSAPLNYALGVLLSRQKRWSDAQQYFFAAFTRDPESPDIHFNLAVSLDNLGKSATAANFYRSALDLARTRASSFDKTGVSRRLRVLE